MSDKKRDDKISLFDIESRRQRITVTPIPQEFVIDSPVLAEREETPVIDTQTLAFREIGVMSKHVRSLVRATNNQAKYVAQIPILKETIEQVRAEATKANQKIDLVDVKLSTELELAEKRMDRVEEKTHECSQASVILDLREEVKSHRKDSTESVRTGETVKQHNREIEKLDRELKGFANTRRNFLIGIVGSVGLVLTSVGSLIWFLAALDAKVEVEQKQQEQRYKALETQIGQIDKGAPSRSICDTLTPAARIHIRKNLPRQDWPSCLE